MTSKEERVSETKGRASDRRREGASREPSPDKARGELRHGGWLSKVS